MADYRRPGGHIEEAPRGRKRDGGPPADIDGPDPAKVSVDVPTVSVSLAVSLVEGTTGGTPIEIPAVSIQGIEAVPKLKSGRYLLFLDVDLPEPPTPTVVSVDGGDRYRDVTRQVVVTKDEDLVVPPAVAVYPPSDPTVPVWLFPDDATVLYGYVRDTDGNRISGGELRIIDADSDLTAATDANGRYLIYFPAGAPDDEVTVQFDHDDLENSVSDSVEIEEDVETIRTLEVDFDAETVTVHEGWI